MTVLTDPTYEAPIGQSSYVSGQARPPAHAAARAPRRSTVLIATGAVLVALWLGLTAPAVSPVAGLAPAGQPVAPAAVVQGDTPPALVQPPLVPGGPGGRGRR